MVIGNLRSWVLRKSNAPTRYYIRLLYAVAYLAPLFVYVLLIIVLPTRELDPPETADFGHWLLAVILHLALIGIAVLVFLTFSRSLLDRCEHLKRQYDRTIETSGSQNEDFKRGG